MVIAIALFALVITPKIVFYRPFTEFYNRLPFNPNDAGYVTVPLDTVTPTAWPSLGRFAEVVIQRYSTASDIRPDIVNRCDNRHGYRLSRCTRVAVNLVAMLLSEHGVSKG